MPPLLNPIPNRIPTPIPDLDTEPNTEQTDTEATQQQNKAVLQRSATAMAHGHQAPIAAIFTELENSNVISYTVHTAFAQDSNTNQRRTTNQVSLYLWYKETDQGGVIIQIEDFHTEQLSSTAYKARAATLLEAPTNVSEHTRIMVFLHALMFSEDATTQTQDTPVPDQGVLFWALLGRPRPK